MMNFRNIPILLVTLIVAIVATNVFSKRDPTSHRSEPITLEELSDRGVGGRLGIRLGTIVEIAGRVVANESHTKADEGEPFLLSVDQVAGLPIHEPALFRPAEIPLADKITPLKIGNAFRCKGYETGQFDGIVVGDLPVFQGPGYGFHTHFVISSSNKE